MSHARLCHTIGTYAERPLFRIYNGLLPSKFTSDLKARPIKHMPSLGVSSLRLGPLTAALFYRVRRAGATHVALSFPKIASGDELRPRNDAWRSCMGSELRIPNAAAQTRIVSGGPFGRAKESLSRHLKYMAGARILEFESYMPSQPVRL